MTDFLAGNGNRRLGLDRRVFSYFSHIPERRGGKERRSGEDRRMNRRKFLRSAVAVKAVKREGLEVLQRPIDEFFPKG
jgi:hypothetical protein